MVRAYRKVAYGASVVRLVTVVLLLTFVSYLTNVHVRISSLARVVWCSISTATMKPACTMANASFPAVITVAAAGNFSERVHQFIVQLDDIRRRTWQSRGVCEWNYQVYCTLVQVLLGARDDYLDVLAAKYPHVTTVTLPWISNGERVWNSLKDTVNVPRQIYYEWTADNALCNSIEARRVMSKKYRYNRTCIRHINATLSPRTLRPLFLNRKVARLNKYPEHLYSYTSPPPFVFYMHIHRDAIATDNGDVQRKSQVGTRCMPCRYAAECGSDASIRRSIRHSAVLGHRSVPSDGRNHAQNCFLS